MLNMNMFYGSSTLREPESAAAAAAHVHVSDVIIDATETENCGETMVTIGIHHPHRDRRISSECEEMLRELYDEIEYCDKDNDDNTSSNSSHSHNIQSRSPDSKNMKYRDDECYDSTYMIDETSVKEAVKTDYEWNYTMPILTHICGFYGLKKRGTKREIIENIADYETNPQNIEIVKQRKQIFEFMRLIKEHEYMKRFILFP